jgi:hypothetical protein
MTKDDAVLARKQTLLSEAAVLLHFIRDFYKDASDDPLFDPAVLADCVRRGILDAPHIAKNEIYRGILTTRMIDGKCLAYDTGAKKPMDEQQRLNKLKDAGLLAQPATASSNGIYAPQPACPRAVE